MRKILNKLLDFFSNYLAHRKGLLPLMGMGLVICNFFIKFLSKGWLANSDIFLHLGIVIAIFGFLLAWAL